MSLDTKSEGCTDSVYMDMDRETIRHLDARKEHSYSDEHQLTSSTELDTIPVTVFGAHEYIQIEPTDDGYKATLSSTGDTGDEYTRTHISDVVLNGSVIRPCEELVLEDVSIGMSSLDNGSYVLLVQ